jgi:hypothetical protein
VVLAPVEHVIHALGDLFEQTPNLVVRDPVIVSGVPDGGPLTLIHHLVNVGLTENRAVVTHDVAHDVCVEDGNFHLDHIDRNSLSGEVLNDAVADDAVLKGEVNGIHNGFSFRLK